MIRIPPLPRHVLDFDHTTPTDELRERLVSAIARRQALSRTHHPAQGAALKRTRTVVSVLAAELYRREDTDAMRHVDTEPFPIVAI
jgi:hypothetical protein